MAFHPEVQHAVAELFIELEGIEPQLDQVAREWTDNVQHGAMWVPKIFATKYRAVEAAWRVVDQALEIAGGFGIFREGAFEQLFRDARIGRLHPANAMLTHEICGKLALGLDPDASPRWG